MENASIQKQLKNKKPLVVELVDNKVVIQETEKKVNNGCSPL